MSDPLPRFQSLPPERWAEARRLYEAEELPVAEIARLTGISRSGIHRKISAQGWGPSEPDAAEAAPPVRQPPAPSPFAALASRLQNFVAARVAALEAGAAKADRDPERTARAVTALVRAFGELEALRQKIALEPAVATDEAPVRPLAELRDDVAERLIALRAQARRRAKAGGLTRGGSPAAMRGLRTDLSVTIDEIHRRRR
ncbi:MAG TPA: helix-turn-helix domain-containing protein [Beijerinckiaceae bacterium]|jgi:hypothetical protein